MEEKPPFRIPREFNAHLHDLGDLAVKLRNDTKECYDKGKEVQKRLGEKLEREQPDFVSVLFGGSVAKGTALNPEPLSREKDNHPDIDLVVVFKNISSPDVEKYGQILIDAMKSLYGKEVHFLKGSGKEVLHAVLTLDGSILPVDLCLGAKHPNAADHTSAATMHSSLTRRSLTEVHVAFVKKQCTFTKDVVLIGKDWLLGFKEELISSFQLEVMVIDCCQKRQNDGDNHNDAFIYFLETLRDFRDVKIHPNHPSTTHPPPCVVDPADATQNIAPEFTQDVLKAVQITLDALQGEQQNDSTPVDDTQVVVRSNTSPKPRSNPSRRLQPRNYQQELFNQAKDKNVIIQLGTGKGKTLIATMLIDWVLKNKPEGEGIIVFLAPRQVLVDQQAKYCRANCVTKPFIEELKGDIAWSEEDWKACIRRKHLIVATPEIIRQALQKGKLGAQDVRLVILDECHNTTGNSPMGGAVDLLTQNNPLLRILGLTASFHNRGDKKYAKNRRKLETRLNAQLTTTQNEDEENEEFARKQHHTNVKYADMPATVEEGEKVVRECIQQAFNITEEKCGHQFRDAEKIGRHAGNVLSQLGLHGVIWYLNEGVVNQLKDQFRQKQAYVYMFSDNSLLQLKQELDDISAHCREELQELDLPKESPKLEVVRKIVKEELNKSATARGIILAQQRSTVYALYGVLKNEFPCNFLIGQTDLTSNPQLEEFRTGLVKVLIATDVLEEGIDVPECSFVIRFDQFHRVTNHIQGSGRARKDQAMVYYLENDSNKEKERTRELLRVARNPQLASTQDEIETAQEQIYGLNCGARYPLLHNNDSPQTSITIFNCTNIFNAYISAVARRMQSMEHWEQQDNLDFPTPTGIQSVTSDEADKFFEEIDEENFRKHVHSKNQEGLTNKVLRQRIFKFIALEKLVKQGFLGDNNEATEYAQQATEKQLPQQINDSTPTRIKPVPTLTKTDKSRHAMQELEDFL